MSHRVALIHAVAVAMEPIRTAFDRLWPEAERMNLLDDSLSTDLAASRELSHEFHARMTALAAYASQCRCDAVMFTCSAFGPAIDTAARTFHGPVLKPNEAMFEKALEIGGRIAMLTTFEPSGAPMQREFADMAAARGAPAAIETVCVPDAMAALRDGDGDTHDRLLADAARRLDGCDVIMLAQFSMARARPRIERTSPARILTSPDTAVEKLKALCAAAPTPR